jgi:hypothetical protein
VTATEDRRVLGRRGVGVSNGNRIDRDWTEEDVVSVPFAGMEILGLSRQGSYDAARRGEIPTIRLGRRLVVPVIPLRRLLGEAV